MNSSLLSSLQHSDLARAIATSNHLVGAALQVVHIVGLLLVLASVILIALRAFSWVLRGQSLAIVGADSSRLLWTGLAIAVPSGILIFIASAVRYANNPAFDAKLLLLAGAILVQFALQWRARSTGAEAQPWVLRGLAATALVLWFGAAGAARAIGFV
jgi:hypothetical protein